MLHRPGAIALTVFKLTCSYLDGEVDSIELKLNSGIYKMLLPVVFRAVLAGNLYAALGAIAADPSMGLECLRQSLLLIIKPLRR